MILAQLLACRTVADMRWYEWVSSDRVNQSTQVCLHRFSRQSGRVTVDSFGHVKASSG